MDTSKPPPYYTPAQVYQPGPPQPHVQLYPPMPEPPPQVSPMSYMPQMPQPSPQMPPPQATVIIQTTPGPTVALGDTSARTTCPSCHSDIVTSVQHSANCKTHTIALLLCLFICWPCVCIPYCMDSCQNADHYCPNCGAFIGTHVN